MLVGGFVAGRFDGVALGVEAGGVDEEDAQGGAEDFGDAGLGGVVFALEIGKEGGDAGGLGLFFGDGEPGGDAGGEEEGQIKQEAGGRCVMIKKRLGEGRDGSAGVGAGADGVDLAGAEEEEGEAGDVVVAKVMHQAAAAGDEEDLEEVVEVRGVALGLVGEGELQGHDDKAFLTQAVPVLAAIDAHLEGWDGAAVHGGERKV